MNLDFLWRLNAHLNSMGLYAKSNVGNLTIGSSISVSAMPGGISRMYYDGIRDQDYNIQIAAKSNKQEECIGALNAIMHELLTINVLPSNNGSYEFDRFIVESPPSFIGETIPGMFTYELSAIAKLTINRGVI